MELVMIFFKPRIKGSCNWMYMFYRITCVSEYLLKTGNKVLGIDNINDYYDHQLRKKNIKILQIQKF